MRWGICKAPPKRSIGWKKPYGITLLGIGELSYPGVGKKEPMEKQTELQKMDVQQKLLE